jgi:hypothetical protein
MILHNHTCFCGSPDADEPHNVGSVGCFRLLTPAPKPFPGHENDIPEPKHWLVNGVKTRAYSLHKRGYYRHPCGCWSKDKGTYHGKPEPHLDMEVR